MLMGFGYGCIGEKLGHSFSVEIHSLLGDYDYRLLELSPDELGAFLARRDFLGINVTIPYKETVIPYLDETDDSARSIGAVNTVVNRGGRLVGYNTDIYGMGALFDRAGIELRGRRVAILGTGGTSKTAAALAEIRGADFIYTVSRTPAKGQISYPELGNMADLVDVIINTTPVGMFPSDGGMSVDPADFPNLVGVADAVYNPLRTDLVRRAEKMRIPSVGGLYMLVSQAAKAAELFFGDRSMTEKTMPVYRQMLRRKRNIVLIGMPSSGKTTVGRMAAEKLDAEFFDCDEIFRRRFGEIGKFFSDFGEAEFRLRESAIVKELAQKNGVVIATGGGAVKNPENMRRLAGNGIVFFLDRAREELIPTPDRPLSSSAEALESLWEERIELYRKSADVIIPGKTPEDAVRRICEYVNTYAGGIKDENTRDQRAES